MTNRCSVFCRCLRADFTAHETYEYVEEPPLDCPILAVTGIADPLAPPEVLTGWRRHTRAAFEARVVPGDHFFLQSHGRLLLRLIARYLATDLTRDDRRCVAARRSGAAAGPDDVHVWSASLADSMAMSVPQFESLLASRTEPGRPLSLSARPPAVRRRPRLLATAARRIPVVPPPEVAAGRDRLGKAVSGRPGRPASDSTSPIPTTWRLIRVRPRPGGRRRSSSTNGPRSIGIGTGPADISPRRRYDALIAEPCTLRPSSEPRFFAAGRGRRRTSRRSAWGCRCRSTASP